MNKKTRNVQSSLEKSRLDTVKSLQKWHEESAALLAQQAKHKTSATQEKNHSERRLGLSLDPWQEKAYQALSDGKNVVVDAPTTAGKTRIVEVFFSEHLENPQFRAAYTTPVKSLSNDKFREFCAMFGKANVGLATGDIKENLNAPIVVTTLETYRNSLLGVDPDLGRTLVVFDEYHFMQDESRGSAWEEAIVLSPESCQLLLISASVANAPEFVDWISKIHSRACEFVQTVHRPVPLTPLIHYNGQWYLSEHLPIKELLRGENPRKKKPGYRPRAMPIDEFVATLPPLIGLGLTPCIVYAGRRKSTEEIIRALRSVLEPLPEATRRSIGEQLMQEQKDFGSLNFIDNNLRALIQTYGIAYHHSGMAPAARIAVESLLKNGHLRFCAATMGLSIGINFSVKSALISDYTRPGERGLTGYSASEVLQMLGRAGRRGRDVIGFSLWPNLEAFQTLSSAKRDRCDSRLKNDPTTFLGLVGQGLDGKDIEQFYAKSFRRYGDKGIDLGLIRKTRVMSKINAKTLPCDSPANAYARFVLLEDHKAEPCASCSLRRECHRYIEAKGANDLAALQLHLQALGALSERDTLTSYGEIAKYFPQSGGMVLASYVHRKGITEKNLGACAELMAAISLARFKQPNIDAKYKFPFDSRALEDELMMMYPQDLFPELWDEPFGKRDYSQLREFNPEAGYVIRLWMDGMPWKDFSRRITTEKFAEGDLIGLIYRVASYMQSMAQAKIGDISKSAGIVREQLLRDPLGVLT